ncbi:MAG: tetratricopeptide repeat protein [Terriglobia bacterium]
MMGLAYERAFRDAQAIQEYQAAEKAEPDFPGVHSDLGLVYWRRDEINRAKAEFEQELRRFPADPVSNCLLGEIELRQSQPAIARAHFQVALNGNRRYKEAWQGLGKAEIMLRDPQGALAPLRRAIALDPKLAQAHYLLADALEELGQTAQARKERAISAQIQAEQQARYTQKLNSPH